MFTYFNTEINHNSSIWAENLVKKSLKECNNDCFKINVKFIIYIDKNLNSKEILS